MKKLKKVVSAVIAASMAIASIVPLTLVSAEGEESANEYIYVNGNAASSVTGFNAGDPEVGIISSADGEQPTAVYNINLQNSGEYDIWIDGVSNYSLFVKFNWGISYQLDSGKEHVNRATSVKATDGYMGAVETGWMKIGTESISAGEHSLTFKAVVCGSNQYVAAIKHLAVVPRDWGWTPNISDTPQRVEASNNDIIWIEAETVASANIDFDEKASQQTVVSIAGGTDTFKGDYDVNIDKAGEYEVYVLGTPFDADYLSSYKFGIDTEEDNLQTVSSASGALTYMGNWQYAFQHGGAAIPFYWQKLTSQELSEGKHTLSFKCDTERAAGGIYFGLDLIAVVPKGGAVNLDRMGMPDGIAELQIASLNIPSTVTEDLLLPTVMGRDTTVTWTSSNTDVLSNDGKVTVPEFDTDVTLTAVFNIKNNNIDLKATAFDDESFRHDTEEFVTKQLNLTVRGEKRPDIGLPVYPSENNEYVMKKAIDYKEAVGYADPYKCGIMGILGGSLTDPQPKLVYEFELANSGYYDIWIDTVTDRYASPFVECKLDNGNAMRNRADTNCAETGRNDQNLPMGWTKIATVAIRKGTHTLEFDALWQSDYNRYISWIQRMAVVPSDWNWSPNMSDAPKKIDSKIIWGEAESFVMDEGVNSEHDENASSGGYTFVMGEQTDGKVFNNDYSFKTEEAGEYTIYALGTPGDWENTSSYKFGIDGGTKTPLTSIEGDHTYWADNQFAYLSSGVPIYWQRVCDAELNVGNHTISFEWDSPRTVDSNYLFALDLVAIVPKNDSIDLNAKGMADGIAELQASTIDIPSVATGDIDLPTVMGRDTTVTWTSSKPDVISNEGKVTIPAADTEVTLTATFNIVNKGVVMGATAFDGSREDAEKRYNLTDEDGKPIPITREYKVKVNNPKSFAFTEASSLTPGSTVEAVAAMGESAEASVLYTAVYDNNGTLISVALDKLEGEGTAHASVTLPEGDLTGYKVRAFLWTPDNVPIKDAIELK